MTTCPPYLREGAPTCQGVRRTRGALSVAVNLVGYGIRYPVLE